MNIVPVTVVDIASLLASILHAVQDPLFLAFVFMCTFSIIMFIRYLFIGGRL